MYLENLVVDAAEPQRLGRFWEAALGTQRLTDEPDVFETRLLVQGGPVLDLCFQRVPEPPSAPLRLHVELLGGDRAAEVASGPIAALAFDSADPDRDARFWSWLTGWPAVPDAEPPCLRHPSGRGPLLELRPERAPKGAVKNRRHLDVRLEAGEDADEIAAAIAARGGREVRLTDAPVPWRTYADPSGNEFCVLPARP
ncbi:MAG TPA: VOC family protein [Jatrophihabitans sp.]|nr:VOC family protein [Jatrophihabitans sp.]